MKTLEEAFEAGFVAGRQSRAKKSTWQDEFRTWTLGLGLDPEKTGPMPYRRRLPDERQGFTHKFQIADFEGYLNVGLYPDGLPGEIFIHTSKEGSTLSGAFDTVATLASVALQYGVPMADLVRKFSYVRFEPNGWSKNPDIGFAHSVIDYVFRYLGKKFLPEDQQPQEEHSIAEQE